MKIEFKNFIKFLINRLKETIKFNYMCTIFQHINFLEQI